MIFGRRARMNFGSLPTNVLELFGMEWIAYAINVIRKEMLGREGEAVMMRGGNKSALQWVMNCKYGQYDVRGHDGVPGALKVRGSGASS